MSANGMEPAPVLSMRSGGVPPSNVEATSSLMLVLLRTITRTPSWASRSASAAERT